MSKKNKRGTEDDLADLHGMMAQYFSGRLKSGEALAPSELNCIRQFLKDNGIDCVGGENADMNDITNNLPTFDVGDVEDHLLN
ncbi:MAG: hypothetical protein R3Y11_11045 [Pseudomonadota bacterium]